MGAYIEDKLRYRYALRNLIIDMRGIRICFRSIISTEASAWTSERSREASKYTCVANPHRAINQPWSLVECASPSLLKTTQSKALNSPSCHE